MEYHLPLFAMSEEQLSAFLAKLKDDVGLQEKLKGAADLDAAVVIAKEAGFDVNKAELHNHQAKQTVALSDEDLEGVAGGRCAGGRWSEDCEFESVDYGACLKRADSVKLST
jgi:predicted ribosomally synthesized peptide with nif11-like leader